MDMPIDAVTQKQAIARVIDALHIRKGGWVITPNLDQLRQYHQQPELREMYEQAELVLADGMPLLWASRLQHTPLPQRVAGSELIYKLTEAAALAGKCVFLLGGQPGHAESAAVELRKRYPLLGPVQTHCPAFGFEKDPAQMRAIVEAIKSANPDVIYVGLGFPKQEKLIAILKPEFPSAWFLGIGISFSFVSGNIRRAPTWMQKIGLEWMHRMMQEPGRLFKRYIIYDLPFAVRVFYSAFMHR